jgi:hypothetical protein
MELEQKSTFALSELIREFVRTIICAPFDRAAIHIVTYNNRDITSQRFDVKNIGFFNTMKGIKEQEGISGIWRFVYIRALISTITYSIHKIPLQEKFIRNAPKQEYWWRLYLCITAQKILTSLFTYPFEVAGIKYIAQFDPVTKSRKFKGLFDALSFVFAKEGITGVYKGFGWQLISYVIEAAFICFFDRITKLMDNVTPASTKRIDAAKQAEAKSALKTAGICLGFSLIAAMLISIPVDTALFHVKLGAGEKATKGVWEVLKEIYQGEGLTGLFKGIIPRFISAYFGNFNND